MKIRQISFALFIALTVSQFVRAQSGRAIELPTATPEVSTSTEAVKEYPPCEKGLAEIIYLPPKKIKDFTEDLNRLGSCGYRLEHSNKLPFSADAPIADIRIFGIVKLYAGNKFEYQWFEAESGGEIVTRANARAKTGFCFRQNIIYLGGKSNAAQIQKKENEDVFGTLATTVNLSVGLGGGSIFIFERQHGSVRKCEYRVLNGADDRGEKALARNQKKLDQYVSKSFRPVGLYYTGIFDVFMIIAEKDEAIKPVGEYLLLREHFGLNKKFTKLSQKGYQPVFVGYYFTILQRVKNEPLPVSYDSAENPNELIKKMPRWTKQNSKYHGKGLTGFQSFGDVFEGELYFAAPLAAAKKYDYQFLEMTNFYERYFKKKDKAASHRDPPTAEMRLKFQELLKAGYVVRDIYFFQEIIVIFERESNTTQIKF